MTVLDGSGRSFDPPSALALCCKLLKFSPTIAVPARRRPMSDIRTVLAQIKLRLEATLSTVDRALADALISEPAPLIDSKERAMAILGSMQRRAGIVESPLNEGCWAILLDLYANHGKRRVSVSSAGIASGAPATTGLRWVKHLLEADLIIRLPDANDGRRIYLALTATGRTAVARYLQS